jgi:hypothetical protein
MTTLGISRPDLEHQLGKITEAIELARCRLSTVHGWRSLVVTRHFTKLQRRRRAIEARLRQIENNGTCSSEPFYINAPKLGGVLTTGLMRWLDRLDASQLARLARPRDRH